MTDTPADHRSSPLDRLLGIFSDVRPGESVTAILMMANILLILTCYYIIKTIREPLILQESGAEVKSYAAAGQALILMGFIPLYSWFSARVDRLKLIVGVTLFFLVNVELFSIAIRGGMPGVGVVFFIWVGFFSLTIIAQFWSYANDIYAREAGDRLFPIIGIGMTAGSPLGSRLAELLFTAGVKPATMLHLSAVLLLVSLGLYLLVDRREQRRADASQSGEVLAAGNGFALVFKSRYLGMIAGLVVLLNVVNTTGEYILGRLVVQAAESAAAADPGLDTGAFIGAFYGNFFFWVNVVAVLVQAFLVSRLVKHAGLAGVLLALPLVSMGAYGIVALGAGFGVIRWAKTAENATDYSVMNTARQLLWLPTSREEKYKAKQAVDTFFVRFGDLISAGVVFAGTHWLLLDVPGFAFGNLLLVAAWLGLAFALIRENRRLVSATSSV